MQPTIYLVDASTKHPGFPKRIIAALSAFVIAHFEPVWHTPCDLALAPTRKPVKGAWNMVFVDNADVADALGYHEFYRGYPLAKVFMETTLASGEDPAVTASHELAEMLVDPSANLTAKGPNGLLYAYETADAVEMQTFPVLGVHMTNFVTPEWFENHAHPKGTKYDHLGTLKKPFQLAKGGYAAVQKNGRWTQIFGSIKKEELFKKEDRRGHRVEALRF